MHFLRHPLLDPEGGGTLTLGTIAVIGVGQSLRGDDAAGTEAVAFWQSRHTATALNPRIRTFQVEGSCLDLMETLATIGSAIIVDAVKSGATPGTIHRVPYSRLAEGWTHSASAHGWGVAEIVRLHRKMSAQRPLPELRFIGIEVEQTDIGAGLSQAVDSALPEACAAIQEEVAALLQL